MSHSLRYLLAFAVPLTVAAALTPLAARVARRAGIMAHPRADRFRSGGAPTPYLGGVAVAAGVLLVAGLITGTSGTRGQLLVVLFGALAVAALGLLDDIRNVGPLAKVAVEGAAGLGLWLGGIRAGLFDIAVLDLLLTVSWVVIVTNAMNVLDNMDGVAAGVGAVGALGLAAIAASQGDYLVTSLGLAVAGGCLGFLPYNFPPARIFLGDAGSLLVGFLLASIGLKLDLIGPTSLARAIVPVLALAVPLFDMLLVVIARSWEGRPVYLGSTDHTAHRLQAKGVRPRAIAVLAYAAQGGCSLLALIVSGATEGVAWVSFALTLPIAAALLTLLLRIQVQTMAAPGSAAR